MNIAGHPLRFLLREPESPGFFRQYASPAEGSGFDLCVSDEDMAYVREKLPDRSDAYLECRYLIDLTARYLLQFGACIMHAAAFSWQGRAWLLAAPSGTGKSTQLLRWAQLVGTDLQVICGDMPALSVQADGSVTVWPTPWNGKESWGGGDAAPLGGVLFLEQAEENTVERLSPEQSVFRFFRQFPRDAETPEQVLALARLIDRCAAAYPVWLLKNRGDLESARLSIRAIRAYLSEEGSRHETL